MQKIDMLDSSDADGSRR